MMPCYIIDSPFEVVGTMGTPGQIHISDGTFSVQVKAPTGLVGDIDYVLPALDGTDGQILTWNGSNTSEWSFDAAYQSGQSLPAHMNFGDATGLPALFTSFIFTPFATHI